jgi:hypothetical protein
MGDRVGAGEDVCSEGGEEEAVESEEGVVALLAVVDPLVSDQSEAERVPGVSLSKKLWRHLRSSRLAYSAIIIIG